ncbi:MAG TPA: JAB domain-containing protein [Allosphingosinicella sp.]|nr:JAB domain-containing protein [Allosphingosinicella sp.]
MLIRTAADATHLLAPFFASQIDVEAVAVLHLDQERRLLGTTFSEGVAEQADLPLREILGAALRVGAAAIIVAHNHPSGDPEPSEQDLSATRRLFEAAGAAGIRLVDHLIFAGGECRSLRKLGLL